MQSDRCFLHDSCSSSMSSRVRDILKFTSKICAPLIIACSTRKQKKHNNLFENARTNETWDPCSQPVCVQVVADNDQRNRGTSQKQMKCRRVVGLVAIFPPGCLGNRRRIGAHNLRAATAFVFHRCAMFSSVPLLRQSCQDMGQSRPVHVEKDFW